MSSPTGIHNLPTEVIEKIISDRELTFEFYDLALLSRRFNSLATPRLLAVLGASNPTKSLYIQLNHNSKDSPSTSRPAFWNSRDSLAGLAISFDLQSIDDLTCALFPYLPLDIMAYERLFRILGRLKRVGKATIIFRPIGLSTRSQSSSGPRLGDSQWAEFLGRLLNLFVEKGCESLAIENKVFSWEYIPDQNAPNTTTPNPLLSKFRALASAGRQDNTIIIPDKFNVSGQLKPLALSKSALENIKMAHLDILGITLLRRPYFSWTYSVLESPSLTSLNLSHVYLWVEMWEVAFSRLLVPLQSKLLKLTIHDCRAIPPGPLFKFLKGLKSLTHLGFSYSYIPTDYEETLPNPSTPLFGTPAILPDLVWLRTYPEWINILLPKTTSRSKLRTLVVLPTSYSDYLRNGFTSFIQKMDIILSSPGLPNPNSNLDINATPQQVTQDSELHLDITLDTSSLTDYNPSAFKADFEYHRRNASARPKNDARITSVTFAAETVSLFSGKESINRLCTFVGWWTNFKTVELVAEYWSVVRYPPDEIFQQLAVEAKLACPHVKQFILDGNTYDVEQAQSAKKTLLS